MIQLNFDAGGTSFRVGGTTVSCSVSRPGRGGRLNGAVAAGVRFGNAPAAGTVVSCQRRSHEQHGAADDDTRGAE